MTVEVGAKAPAFTLPSIQGGTVALADFASKQPVVLYFYPKDATPGCTTEACDFRDNSERIKTLGVAVLGVSPDSLGSHEKFIENQTLNFPLLADEGHAVCEQFGVWVEKSNYGKKYLGVERSTFLIDQAGRIARVWRQVKVAGHVDEVLAAVAELKSSGAQT